jgi:uncharacterized protein YigA (DUF484 family)
LVAEWLRVTPGFFERYANLLNEIRLKHPHEDRAISLQERQMTLLRTQNQELNRRLSEMLHFGSRNDKTQQSLVSWLLRLMGANSKADVESAVTAGLAEVFEVESAQLLSPNAAFGPWIDTPLCGSAKELASASVDLLATQVTIDSEWQSMVAIGLPLGKSIGTVQSPAVLLLASKDETRFTAPFTCVRLPS